MGTPCYLESLSLLIVEWLFIQLWKQQCEDNPKEIMNTFAKQSNEVELTQNSSMN